MTDIAAFIRARLAEDEDIAQSAIDPKRPGTHWHWETYAGRKLLQTGGEADDLDTQAISLRTVEEYPTRYVGPLPAFIISQVEARVPGGLWHIARHDPARALADVASKRAILEYWSRAFQNPQDAGTFPGSDWDLVRGAAQWTLRHLAAPYAEHPDYQQEWNV